MSPSVSVRLLLTQSDARLMAFARAGHERAFEALVQRYRRQLLGYCRRLLLSQESAEDALQQALLQAWLALRAGTEVGEAKAWLYRIVHNAALNALRISGYDYCKLSESLSGADAPQADLDRRIAVREALAGLATLPQMQREALLRTAVEGRTHQQVARDLGVSENALRGLVYRARTALRAAVGAITPSPLVSWALSGARGTPVVERLAEIGVGGGSAGLAGLLMKGSAVAVTASVLAGGIVAAHGHPQAGHRRETPHAARPLHPSSSATPFALADARSTGVVPSTGTRGDHSRGEPPLPDRPAPRPGRVEPRPSGGSLTTASPPALSAIPVSVHGSDGRGERANGSHDEQGEPRSSSPNVGTAGGEAAANGGGASDHGGAHGEQSSGAGSDRHLSQDSGQGGGSSVGDTSGGFASGNTSGDSSGGAMGSASSGDTSGDSPGASQGSSSGSDGSQGREPAGATLSVEPLDRQDLPEASSSTRTNSSSKDRQSSGAEATKRD
jgi:RNA polymerase sigma factor (sigma-70 family)